MALAQWIFLSFYFRFCWYCDLFFISPKKHAISNKFKRLPWYSFFLFSFFCHIFSFHPLFIIIFLNSADRYLNANKLYVSLHCVCSIHLLTCHLISRLRSRARQHIIHKYIFELRVTKRAQTALQNVSLNYNAFVWMCMPNGSCDEANRSIKW